MNIRGPRPPRILSTSPFNRPPAEPVEPEVYSVDDRVSHDKYGVGSVVRLDGTIAVIVDFGAETRRIEVRSPKLTRL